MGKNLLTYPYSDTTKTQNGITFTDMGDGRVRINGTLGSGVAYFYYRRPGELTLDPGTYTVRSSGNRDVMTGLVMTDGCRTKYVFVEDEDVTFTIEDQMEVTDFSLNIMSHPTLHNFIVYPQIEAGESLSPWKPYRAPTDIDTENGKQIRRSMEVFIEISPPGADPITITNDNLIRADVNLRSDLSILEPTLPESELNVEAYFDTDISATLAEIPDETPVTYRAGYDSDLSTVRQFYLAEQITWHDNIMNIHAVDAVHKLEEDTKADMLISYAGLGSSSMAGVYAVPRTILYLAGISYTEPDGAMTEDVRKSADFAGGAKDVDAGAIKKQPARDVLAKINNYFHQTLPSASFYTPSADFWPAYVDAGIPTLSWKKPTAKWSINEEDCGDIQQDVERDISQIILNRNALNYSGGSLGKTAEPLASCQWLHGVGIFLSYPGEVLNRVALYPDFENRSGTRIGTVYDGYTYQWTRYMNAPVGSGSTTMRVTYLPTDIPKGFLNFSGYELYTQFVPWDTDQASKWNTVHGSSNTDDQSIDMRGYHFAETKIETAYGAAGRAETIEEDVILGRLITIGSSSGNSPYELFPQGAMNSLLNRSNVTGSFTWKGDPRMQPRDVVTFHRLDGTTEDITLENITITHERGGTTAEITYRKGIC